MTIHLSRRESLRALAWRLDSPIALVAMFSVAFLIRLWAMHLGEVGPYKFYGSILADYPPGYLYVLWLIGKLSSSPGYVLLKLPAIVGDLGLAWIAGSFAARIAPTSVRARWPVRTLVAAGVLFNPGVIALSAVWGQVDVVPAVFALWSLFLLFTGPQSL